MCAQLRSRRPRPGVVTCRPGGLTISQCRPTNAETFGLHDVAILAALRRRDIDSGSAASVNGAISMPL